MVLCFPLFFFFTFLRLCRPRDVGGSSVSTCVSWSSRPRVYTVKAKNHATSSRVCLFGLKGERHGEMQIQFHSEVSNYSSFMI